MVWRWALESKSDDASVELHNLTRHALATWSTTDFDAAWNWITKREDTIFMGETKRNCMLEGYATHDFRGALKIAEERGILTDAISYISRSLSTDDDIAAYLDSSTRVEKHQGVDKPRAAGNDR